MSEGLADNFGAVMVLDQPELFTISDEFYVDYNVLRHLTLENKEKIVFKLRNLVQYDYPFIPLQSLAELNEGDAGLDVGEFNKVSTELIRQFPDVHGRASFIKFLMKLTNTSKEEINEKRHAQYKDRKRKELEEWERQAEQKVGFALAKHDQIRHYPISPSFNRDINTLSFHVPGIDNRTNEPGDLTSQSEFKMKHLQKYFDRLHKDGIIHTHPRLDTREKLRNFMFHMVKVNSQLNTLISFDLETYENNDKIVTEIGLAIYDPLKNVSSVFPNILNIHIIIEENQHLRNVKKLPDNRYKFLGGTSMILKYDVAVRYVQAVLDHYFIKRRYDFSDQNAIFVGHNTNMDIKWLKHMGVVFPDEFHVVDTYEIYSMVNGKSGSSLELVLRRLNIPHSYLHNAGNDAYFTLLAAWKLCEPMVRTQFELDNPEKDSFYSIWLKKFEAPPLNRTDTYDGFMNYEFLKNISFNSAPDPLNAALKDSFHRYS